MPKNAAALRALEDRFPELFHRQDRLLILSYAVLSALLSLMHLGFKLLLQAKDTNPDPLYLANTLLCLLASILAIVFGYRGHSRTSGLLVLGVIIWVVFNAAFWDERGLRTPIVVLYVVAILLTDFLYGPRVGALFTGLGIIGTWALFFLQTFGIYKGLQFVAGPPLFNHALYFTIIFTYVHLFNRNFIERNRKVVAKVEESQQQLMESERRRIAEQQSRLLMSEMHDGIGGTLVNLKLLLSARQPDIQTIQSAVDRCLNDLRLTVMAVDPDQPSLGTLMAVMRADYKRTLEASGIELSWTVSDALMALEVPVGTRLHVARVVQEAVTNAIKHAKASRIEVLADVTPPGGLHIRIRDDGIGVDTQVNATDSRISYGLRNMQLRADQGHFSVSSGNRPGGAGFEVCIQWPRQETLPPA